MKTKTAALMTLVIAAILISSPVYASETINDGIQGYVYENGVPKQGLKVEVYRESTMTLEGYGVNPDNSQGELGTDYTDTTGKYHIAWLWSSGEWYVVKVYTPCGIIEKKVQVPCGGTCLDFCYTCEEAPSPGYWRHEINAWLKRNGKGAKEDEFMLRSWCQSPEVAALIGDPDGDSDTDIYDCQMVYNSKDYKHWWHPLANILNQLAGYL